MNSTNPLTVEQTAERLGVKVPTVRSWLSQRRLAYHKLGRRVLIDSRDVELFWSNGRVEAVKVEGDK